MKKILKPDKFKRKRLLSASLSAAAGLTLAAGQARAVEPNVPASTGDLILGFQESGDNDLEVNLGPISNLLNATSIEQINFGVIPGGSTVVTSLAADLSATYGSGWNTSSLLQWGIVGATGNTIFLTIDSGNPNKPQNPATTQANATAGDINNSLIATLGVSPSTTNSTESASLVAGSQNSWDSFLPDAAAFDTSDNIEQLSGVDTATTSTLNLWELVPSHNGGGNGTDVGSFTLNSSGNLTFTPAAVPEPSTWLSFIGGASLLGFFRLSRQRRLS